MLRTSRSSVSTQRQTHGGLEHQALLTREMSHRLKNSLTSVVGLFRVQVRSRHQIDEESEFQNFLRHEHYCTAKWNPKLHVGSITAPASAVGD